MEHTSMPWPVGKTASELLGGPNPRWTELYGRALDTGVPSRVEESEPTLDRVFDLNVFALDRARNRVAVLFTNITERKRAEAALRESEELRRVALDGGGMGAWTWDTRANTVRADAKVQALWGVSIEEQPHAVSLYDDRMYPEGAAWLTAVASKDIAPAEEFHTQVQVASGPTSSRWVELRGRAERDAPWIINGVSFDITGQRQAEERVRAGEERYRLLLESVTDYAIFTMDPAGRITSWPAGAKAVYGWSEAEIIGRSADLTFLPEDVASGAPQNERDTALREGVAPNVRWHRHRDGGRIFIDGSTQPLVGADGTVREFIKIGQDVTEARETQEALARSEERLRLALDAGRLAAWDWNLRTDEVQWSDEHFRMQGYAVGEVRPSYDAWVARVHPDDLAETEAALVAARDDGGGYAHEFRSLHPDGTIRWLSAFGRFFRDDRGVPHRMVGAMIDVTERREWAERLEIMVAELQHRTRNLIAVVSSIARQTMADTGPTEAFRAAFADRMEALSRVQGLLSQAGEERVTVREILELELAALGAHEGNGRVRLDGPVVPLRKSIVQTLTLALHELATNARKYGALANGSGELDVRWTTSRSENEERRLFLEWIESGIKIHIDAGEAVTRGSGYGRKLIEKSLPYTLRAKTTYELSADGLRCTIDLPLTKRILKDQRP